ncbi:hypothetical protein ACQKPX_12460 [Photobacterium sp. DNB23_23_1]|uniref:DUF1496 domain-containing protein n=1 Tax=Photobacterium pectinilyticum TaxID=2906793 RepID=A0ABT1N502_9GAMM|nr:hypothetical protein [Photobacterium sp. ZSDE20]MCQ1059202.1 hypothetical protein [Photobacterium sp. ZSDE20]MDD1824854.1 hypothetical protein [Photobacterium sp. ZSDE20]
MKKMFVLMMLAFSSFTFANSSSGHSGGSTVSTPQIICMYEGKILGVTAIPAYECTKLKKEMKEGSNK